MTDHASGRTCYHCKQGVEAGEAHDCWTTTEAALTKDLSEDLRQAWERLRETAAGFGEQRIYASHHSIMFSRRACYFFVRPRRDHLELWMFLGRTVKAPQISRVEQSSSVKAAHRLRIRHRDEVEAPVTEWLREAYEFAGQPKVRSTKASRSKNITRAKAKTAVRKTAVRKAAARKTKAR